MAAPRNQIGRYSPGASDDVTDAHDLAPEFETGRFPAHGHTTIRIDGDVVFQEHTGPFNAEFFKGLGKFRANLHKSGDLPPLFGVVVTWSGNVLMTPEALDAYREFIKGVRGKVVAYVLSPDAEGMSVMLPVFESIWSQLPRPIDVFSSEAEAVNWVRRQLDALRTAP